MTALLIIIVTHVLKRIFLSDSFVTRRLLTKKSRLGTNYCERHAMKFMFAFKLAPEQKLTEKKNKNDRNDKISPLFVPFLFRMSHGYFFFP